MGQSRIHRLLRLITSLQSGTTKSAAELAQTMGVSRRTLFRDLATLRDAGVPYYHESAKGYRIDPSFFLPPVNLKVTEALGLLLLGKAAANHRDQPFYQPAIDAIQKLACLLPPAYREVTVDMLANVSVAPGSKHTADADQSHFAHLQRAIEQRLVCRMRYHSLYDRADIDVTVHPYHLHHAVRSWYLMGHSVEQNGVRIYKLSRIISLEVTGRKFRLTQPFDVEQHLGNCWSLIPGGKTYRVELEFSAKVGENVAEVLWHKSQQHELLDDGRCMVRFTVDGLDEIAWWLLGYGDQVYVHKPKALRDKLAGAYRKALEKIDNGGGSCEPW